MSEHKLHQCTGNHEQPGCMFCDGGLSACDTCGAFEGAWPDECPGRQMSAETSDDVYQGKLNYRNGCWHPECCQVMRHIYDRDNYMLENGYMKGLDANGNPKWVRVE